MNKKNRSKSLPNKLSRRFPANVFEYVAVEHVKINNYNKKPMLWGTYPGKEDKRKPESIKMNPEEKRTSVEKNGEGNSAEKTSVDYFNIKNSAEEPSVDFYGEGTFEKESPVVSCGTGSSTEEPSKPDELKQSTIYTIHPLRSKLKFAKKIVEELNQHPELEKVKLKGSEEDPLDLSREDTLRPYGLRYDQFPDTEPWEKYVFDDGRVQYEDFDENEILRNKVLKGKERGKKKDDNK